MIHKRNTRRKEFRRFFGALFRPKELVELRFIESSTSKGKRRSRVAGPPRWLPAGELPCEYDKLIEFAQAERANIYFGVCPRSKEGDAIDEAIQTVRCLWADLDDVTVNEARLRWKSAGIPEPSIVVRSGYGIHAYWLLDSDLTTPTERECVTVLLPGFHAAFGGDRVQNLSRVMRPPGTLNYKGARNGMSPTACSLISCNPGLTYPISAFSDWMGRTDSADRRSPACAGTRSLPYAATGCHDNVTTLAARLELPTEDRSRRDFAVVCDMLRLGLSAEEIWAIVADKSKFESNGRPYFDLTFANAEKTVLLGGNSTRAPQAAT